MGEFQGKGEAHSPPHTLPAPSTGRPRGSQEGPPQAQSPAQSSWAKVTGALFPPALPQGSRSSMSQRLSGQHGRQSSRQK